MNRDCLVFCPYCGVGTIVPIKDGWVQKTVVTCEGDGDSPGCGKDFVAVVEVTVKTKAMKIEEV